MNFDKPDINNLRLCTEDVTKAVLENDQGPSDPTNYSQLRGRLEASRNKLPPLYRKVFFVPYVNMLNEIGESGFTQILLRDPTREYTAGLMLDMAHAILQNGEGYEEIATDSFEEIVSDLYDGFLSAEDRRGVNPPDLGAIAPLVKWGNPSSGPYTWPVDNTSNFGAEAAVVSLPPSLARRGLIAWASLGHETAGHDILSADSGLRRELISAIQTTLEGQGLRNGLPEYWSSRIDETASDVLGILNMGPAAGIGTIGFFRGWVAASGREPKLRNEGPANDPHPADILRGYLAASTVSLLNFEGAKAWSKIIESETNDDLSTIVLEGNKVDPKIAIKSAQSVAFAIVNTKLNSLENHALGQIQNWRDWDQTIVNDLIAVLTTSRQLPSNFLSGIYAAHVVAAAVEAALRKNADISSVFSRMLSVLKMMHNGNSSWGPLFIRHPGNVAREMVFTVHDPPPIEMTDSRSLRSNRTALKTT